ncbi:hypothetical protein V6N11_028892 [Hibiscus sabdariffa]|uniref:Uncharacterized protein n=1 Tax=Hibiscus sabdariffa TaxID=183260 RepID=A0ABR1ZQY1_9ROSI
MNCSKQPRGKNCTDTKNLVSHDQVAKYFYIHALKRVNVNDSLVGAGVDTERLTPTRNKVPSLYVPVRECFDKDIGWAFGPTVLTSYYNNDHFKIRPYDPFNVYTSPIAILCIDSFQSMYVQMLCGSIMRGEVLRVGAASSNSFPSDQLERTGA